MAKNNKTAPSAAQQAAAQQAAPEVKTDNQETGKKTQLAVIQLGDLDKLAQQRALVGMDPNHMEDLVGRLDDRFYRDANAAKRYNIAQETVDKINEITARAMVALLANEVEIAQTPFAVRMRMSSLEALKEAGEAMHINIDTKALPAPAADGTVEVPSTAVKVSKEAKEGLAEERKIASEKVELDPTKIENEEALKKSLLNILVKGNGSENLYDKISAAINFYEAYLKVNASKEENADKLNDIKGKSRVDLFSEIAHLLGKCTFTVGGIAKFMYEQTERTKSPVVAFCTLRDASLNKNTGMPQIEDQLVADIVKVLIRWYADTEIATTNEVIASFERDIEILKKDEKKNAKGIETGEQKIETAKKHIDDVEAIVTYANMPDRSVVDNFVTNYTDNKAEGFKLARMIGSKIMKSYYGDTNVKAVKMDSLVHNLQQYAGVITNMFLPALNKLVEYSEANITELEKVEAPAEEPKNE